MTQTQLQNRFSVFHIRRHALFRC